MTKFECKGCDYRHVIESEQKPCRCVLWWDKEPDWAEVAEPGPDEERCGICGKIIKITDAAQDVEAGWCCKEHYDDETTSPLPKLTTAVFERPDCPDWARFAAVEKNGSATWFDKQPVALSGCWSHDQYMLKARSIGRNFDATDWLNSRVERPAKPELPAWCKVGAWVYDTKRKSIQRIIEIIPPEIACSIPGDENNQYFSVVQYLRPIKWRAWNDDEMKRQVGKTIKRKRGHVLLVCECGCQNDGTGTYLFLGHGSIAHDADDMLENYDQLDGTPCGVAVVGGEDGK